MADPIDALPGDDTAPATVRRRPPGMPAGTPSTWAGVIVLGALATYAAVRHSFRRYM